MKTVLYWFSGTGNSLMVAKELARRLGDTQLLPITATLAAGDFSAAQDAQTIGVGVPYLRLRPAGGGDGIRQEAAR